MKKLLFLTVLVSLLTGCKGKDEKRSESASAPVAGSAPTGAAPAAPAPPAKGCDRLGAYEMSAIMGIKLEAKAGDTDCTFQLVDEKDAAVFGSLTYNFNTNDLMPGIRAMGEKGKDGKEVEIAGLKGYMHGKALAQLAVPVDGRTLVITAGTAGALTEGIDAKLKTIAEKLVAKK